ncbi:hypothetical protein TRICI_003554 [Trichomonascus ciferrii]|uniref:F-box domain-containing protein n=1 Tax=Trichomonascus ciferrii TaxID=44093 RepID=A0A642V3R4_9ASCO|nr:hypothetical protein TRICI_003554 [Trichomonascus ciferrii]
MRLEEFPVGVLSVILGYLPFEGLISCRETCRKLHEVARDYLRATLILGRTVQLEVWGHGNWYGGMRLDIDQDDTGGLGFWMSVVDFVQVWPECDYYDEALKRVLSVMECLDWGNRGICVEFQSPLDADNPCTYRVIDFLNTCSLNLVVSNVRIRGEIHQPLLMGLKFVDSLSLQTPPSSVRRLVLDPVARLKALVIMCFENRRVWNVESLTRASNLGNVDKLTFVGLDIIKEPSNMQYVFNNIYEVGFRDCSVENMSDQQVKCPVRQLHLQDTNLDDVLSLFDFPNLETLHLSHSVQWLATRDMEFLAKSIRSSNVDHLVLSVGNDVRIFHKLLSSPMMASSRIKKLTLRFRGGFNFQLFSYMRSLEQIQELQIDVRDLPIEVPLAKQHVSIFLSNLSTNRPHFKTLKLSINDKRVF